MSFCILSSPLLCASRDFSSGFSAFSPLFVRLPLLSLFLRCLQLLHLFFGGFGLLHSPAYSSPSACSLGVPGTSVLPSSGVSMGWGGLYTWSSAQVLPQAPIGVSSLSLPRHFCLCLILRFLLPLFLLSSLRVSQGSLP